MIFRFSFIEKILLEKDIIPHPFVDASAHFITSRALHVSIGSGLIDNLDSSPKKADFLATETGLNEYGIMMILDCLNSIGYVEKNNEGYSLSKRGWHYLAIDSPDNFRSIILHSADNFKKFADLEQVLKTGTPLHADGFESFAENQWDLFTTAMKDIAKLSYQEVAKIVTLPPGSKTALDLGGSHGLYSIGLCKKYPLLSAEVMDFEGVKPVFDGTVKEHKMEDRVKFRKGDFVKEELGSGYDAILAFNIIHGFNLENNIILAKRIHQALNPGGVYVILDQIRGVGNNSDLSRLVTSTLGLNLFLQAGGRTYSFEEVNAFLKESGFTSAKLKKMKTPGFGIITGKK